MSEPIVINQEGDKQLLANDEWPVGALFEVGVLALQRVETIITVRLDNGQGVYRVTGVSPGGTITAVLITGRKA